MYDQKKVTEKGGTMRLGAYDCSLQKESKAFQAYGISNISERHRHRFELNNKYKSALENAGLIATGINKENNLVEVVEIACHPWFVGVQFHPEFKSTVDSPHPLFIGFIKACINQK